MVAVLQATTYYLVSTIRGNYMLEKKDNPPADWKPHVRKGEAIEGGFIVARRGRWAKRIKVSEKPFEHPTLDAALSEKKKLEEKYPDCQFAILIDARFVKELIHKS